MDFLQLHGHKTTDLFHSFFEIIVFLGSSATNLLNLGSDHRAVRATYFIGSEPKKVPHGVHQMKRGWKPILDACGCPTSNHEMLHAELGHEPKTRLELESMCCRASANTNKTATKRYGQEVVFLMMFFMLYWLNGGE